MKAPLPIDTARRLKNLLSRDFTTRVKRQLRLQRLGRLSPSEAYDRWLARVPVPDPVSRPVRFALIVVGDDDGAFARSRATLRPEPEVEVEVHRVRQSECWPTLSGVDLVLVIGAGDRVAPHALTRLAQAALPWEGIVAYADEDRWSRGVRSSPFLKPAWSPLLALTLPGKFPGLPFVMSLDIWRSTRAAESAIPWPDVALLACQGADEIAHVPVPLLSRAAPAGDPILDTIECRERVARETARRHGIPDLESHDDSGRLRMRGQTSDATVTVVVPTRDRADLLVGLCRTLEREWQERPFEVIFVDHETSDPEARRILDDWSRLPAVRVLRASGSFNFSRMVNQGVQAATTQLVLLLNNDVEATRPGWLEPLVRAALLPGIAASGPMLVYPDDTLQHAGIGVGFGVVAAHLGRRTDLNSVPDLLFDPRVTREVSALTAACLMIRRDAFVAVGGFNEDDLSVSFNDVEFCLKLAERGLGLVYEPEARLVHHESASRQPQLDTQEIRYMESTWARALQRDLHWSPALTRLSETPLLDPWGRLDLRPRRVSVPR